MCYEDSHALLVGLLVVPLIIAVVFGFPIGSAICLLAARKNEALNSDAVRETYGFMFQAYKEEFAFWDCMILLRKAALALTVTFGTPMGSNIQEIGRASCRERV